MKFETYSDMVKPNGYELSEEGELCYTLESVFRSALKRPMDMNSSLSGFTQGSQVAFEVFRCAQDAGADMDKFEELFIGVFGLIGF